MIRIKRPWNHIIMSFCCESIQFHSSVFSSLLVLLQLKEVFGAGTACVVSPVNRILFLDEVRGAGGGGGQ